MPIDSALPSRGSPPLNCSDSARSATTVGRAWFKRALPLWANAEQEVRAAMGSKLTADLHGALDRSMEKLGAL